MNDLEKEMFNALYKEYGSMSVSKKAAAEITGMGLSTMDKMRADGRGCPYKQTGAGNVTYNLITLVKYMLADEVKTVA